MTPLIPDTQPDLSAVRVWIGGGTNDPIIATSQTKQLAELLRSAGADVTIRFFEASHALTAGDIDAAHQWLIHQ
jgi:phospholipase/carboxylesterase